MRKLLVPFALAAAMGLFGTSALASEFPGDDFDDVEIDDFDDASPAVPEPTAALVMGAGLATIAVALRRRR